MRRLLLSLVLLMAALGARAAEPRAEPGDELPRVRTLAELKAVEPVDAGDGWFVRLGYGEPEPGVGASWLVLYCLAEHAGAPEAEQRGLGGGERTGEPFGPVSYLWERVSDKRQQRVRQLSADLSRPGLYCATLPTRGKAAMRVAVHAHGTDRLLGERTFPAAVERPWPVYWQSFAVAVSRKEPGQDGAAVVAPEDLAAIVLDEPMAVYPLFRDAAIEMPKREAGDDDDDDDGDLPGLGGAGEADALKLSLDDGIFTIAAERVLHGSAQENLIARWWLNGEAVEVKLPRPGQKLQQQALREDPPQRFEVAFGLPDHLPELKVGDRVGLQVMYAPGGHCPLPIEGLQKIMAELHHAARQNVVDRPLLSNRLEFELTEELLRRADHELGER